MGSWKTYRLEDFIPFTPEIYWRLLERVSEAFWPLHILTIALGMGALLLALRGNPRIALCLAAPAWLSSGIIFHRLYYAELNWAAPWFGWAFVAQAAVLIGIAAVGGTRLSDRQSGRATKWTGTAIATGALLFYPLIAVTLGAGPTHAETFGLHPEPTAIATLGITLVALRGATRWLSLLIPLLWCLTATLTLLPLDAAWAWLPAAVAILTIVILLVGGIRARHRTIDCSPG